MDIRPMGAPIEESATASSMALGPTAEVRDGVQPPSPALVFLARLRSFWRWFTTGEADDPIARYHRTHPARPPLALTHPQRRRAYKRAADALRRKGRDGGTAA